MRKWLTIAGGGLMVAACGGGGGGSDNVTVVPGTPTPTPTPTATPTPAPTPTPTPTATPTPTPTSSYPRFAELTGNRTFQTACASLLLGGSPPNPQPVLSFGEGPTLDYASSTGGWAINGDGVALSFASGDAVTAATGQRSYERSVGGSAQRFTITDTVAGITPDFVRSFALRTDRSAGSTLYSCVFGVPAAAADVPSAATSYTRVGVNGTAYVADQGGGTVQTYVLTASTGTVRFDPAANALVVTVRLLGNLQTAGGVASATTDLGTFTGSGAVDAARGRFYGQIDSADRISLFSSLGGWFFGGSEAGAAFEILALNPNTGNRVSAVGTVVAAR
jgi:hypothetical protein